VLSACEEQDVKYGLQVHVVALKMSLDCNVYVANALITMYGKYSGGIGGGCDHTSDDAWIVFESMEYI
jgi:hypothetical protein